MRFTPWLCCAASAFLWLSSNLVLAQEQEVDPALAAARMQSRFELEQAKEASRMYWQVEYPCERRRLSNAIELADMQIQLFKARLREYYPFDQFETGQPLFITLQDTRLCLRDLEMNLESLRMERNNLVRFHADRGRMLDFRVAQARARLVALEGGGIIEIGVAQNP